VKAAGEVQFDRLAELVKDLKLTVNDFDSIIFRTAISKTFRSTTSYEPEMVAQLRSIVDADRRQQRSNRLFAQHPHPLQPSSARLHRASPCSICITVLLCTSLLLEVYDFFTYLPLATFFSL